MGMLLAMLGQTVGFPVPEGGAGELTQALARRLRAGGGEIRTDAEVVRVEVATGAPSPSAPPTVSGTPPAARSLPTCWPPRSTAAWWRPRRVPDRVRPGCAQFELTPARSRWTGP